MGEVVPLCKAQLEEIMNLEKASWNPQARAKKETIEHRFDLGHYMFGSYDKGQLSGQISFSSAWFSPTDYASFPKTFECFSLQPPQENPNALFVYNLEVAPGSRGPIHARSLAHKAISFAQEHDLTFVVGDGRCSSYNGTQDLTYEKRKPKEAFKSVIDSYMKEGIFPSQKELRQDPTLSLYHKLVGFTYCFIIPQFLPEDRAAGGFRVIGYMEVPKNNDFKSREMDSSFGIALQPSLHQ